VPIKVTALINDTVGTLIASHYVDPTTRMGIIFGTSLHAVGRELTWIEGTGCNAAYMEKCGNIPKLKALGLPDDLDMAINCEWVCPPRRLHWHTSKRVAGRLRFSRTERRGGARRPSLAEDAVRPENRQRVQQAGAAGIREGGTSCGTEAGSFLSLVLQMIAGSYLGEIVRPLRLSIGNAYVGTVPSGHQ
jgi:hypothetical protein